MTLPSPVAGQPQVYKESYEDFVPYHHRRTRTLSLYSVASGKSSRSSVSVTPSGYATPAAEAQLEHPAWGSFIPSTSAAVSLRQFAPSVSKRTANTGTRSLNDTDDEPNSSYIQPARTISSPLPALSRTPLHSPFLPGPPSGTSSSASSIHLDIKGRTRTSSDLHPVLARLERGSKLCGQMVCATCRKPGRDYPQCGKCKKMWCSRECRLVNGKRHKC